MEFTIKTHNERYGIANESLSSKPGDEVLMYCPFGDISYKWNGVFIAGGAGITPLIAILIDLEKKRKEKKIKRNEKFCLNYWKCR